MLRPLLLALSLLVLVACYQDDDDTLTGQTAELALDFTAEFSDVPLRIQSGTYDYPTGEELKVLLFQYYVSDLELLPRAGAPVPLSEIDLVRYETAGGSETVRRNFAAVPAGDYVGLRFGLGVKPSLNARDPSSFAADFVLNQDEFWNDRARYVFAKIEANARLVDSTRFSTGLSYHMGADELYTTVQFDEAFRLRPGANRLTVVADVLAALSDGRATFDISDPTRQRVHGGNQAVATDIWNRLAAQFQLRTN